MSKTNGTLDLALNQRRPNQPIANWSCGGYTRPTLGGREERRIEAGA